MSQSHSARWAKNQIHTSRWERWGRLPLEELIKLFAENSVALYRVGTEKASDSILRDTRRSVYLADKERIDELLALRLGETTLLAESLKEHLFQSLLPKRAQQSNPSAEPSIAA